MKILITGVLGYIGSWMAEEAVQRHHRVTGLDAGFYRQAVLYRRPRRDWALIEKDVRDVTEDDLAGFDAVIHLAELSNDPLGQLDPALTRRINFEGSVRLARVAKAAGVPRFLYSSSCSVYGIGEGDEVKTEDSPVAPQTEYARCKVMVERAVAELADESFSPLFLRNATAYGPSPAMRFDLVLNNLAGMAYTSRRIALTSDGTPWRPLVHVRDICAAFLAALETPRERWHNRVLNVGSSAENFRVREIADLVARTFPGCELTLGTRDPDTRSYRVCADRIREVVPSFRPLRTAADGARELRETFEAVGLTRAVFEHPAFTRLARLRGLLARGRLDADLRWREVPVAPRRQGA
ncbi:MAG: SDR family oxidoreductase [Kiritimatiellae bacterium]|nr:SDR family oxidoreductase [Kiritimatiellia bacterium]